MIDAPTYESVSRSKNVPYHQSREIIFIAFSSSYLSYLLNGLVSSSSVTRPGSNCKNTGKKLELSSTVISVMPRSKI